jgi:carbon-monoxide dehydrogenase medium subunit
MFPSTFDYVVATSLEEALAAKAEAGDEARFLAGGQSLLPMMKIRLANPAALIDINRLPGLDTIERVDGHLRVGALVRHAQIAASDLTTGAVASAAPWIADPLVRNLGTMCGSVAHCDPEGDWNSVLLAVGADVVVQGPSGERVIPIEEFVQGMFTTALADDEMVTEVRIDMPAERSGGAYLKLERKVGDFATVGVAVQVSLDGASVREVGIALTSVSPINMRAARAEEALRGREPTDEAIRDAARLAAEECDPIGDLRGTVEYKRNVVRVYVEWGLWQALASAGGEDGGNGGNGGPEGKPQDEADNVGPDYFAGEDTIEGVIDEIDQKEEQ